MSKEIQESKSSIPQNVVAINHAVETYINNSQIATNLEKSWVTAQAVAFLREHMDDEFMKPIMALQGTKLGFVTDKDKKKIDGKYVKGDGYDISIVKDVCIEALMNGLELNGNLFNIIADRFYITREGFEYLLNKANIDYDFDCSIPIQSSDNKSAEVTVNIRWVGSKGEENTKTLPLKIKSDQWASADSIIGKAKRKAGCWLVNKLKGTNFADGDATEVESKDVVIDMSDFNEQKLQELIELFTDEAKEIIEKDKKGTVKSIQAVIDNKEASRYQAVINHIKSKVEK